MARFDTSVVITEPDIQREAESRDDYAKLGKLPFIEKLMVAYAARFIFAAQNNLKKDNKVDTGTLEKDLAQGDLIRQGSNYAIDIGYPETSAGAKYYDFVNKGVKGFKSGTPNSPYRFRSAYPSMNGPMVTAIQKWVKRNARSQRNEDQKYNLSSLQTKRKSVAQLNTGRTTAYLIARKIKQQGLKRTGFFDDAITEVFNQDFYDKMAKAVGADVVVYIKQASSLLNNENK